MMQQEQQYPTKISFFDNGSGGINAHGQWMSEDEARELWEDLVAVPDEEEKEPFPPFTGQEFIDTNETIDSHPYATAFGQFLAHGVDANVANELAFGLHSAISDISADEEDPLRQRATDIFDRFQEMNYWRDSEDLEREPDDFNTGFDLGV